MKIKYSIEYHRPSKEWVVWKEIEKDKGFGFKSVFRGTKKECKEIKKQYEEKLNNDK